MKLGLETVSIAVKKIISSPGLVVALPQRCHLFACWEWRLPHSSWLQATGVILATLRLSDSPLGATVQDAVVRWELGFELAAGLF